MLKNGNFPGNSDAVALDCTFAIVSFEMLESFFEENPFFYFLFFNS